MRSIKQNSGDEGRADGVGGEIPNRWIAEAVARDLGCEARSVSPEEANDIWGEFGALIMAASSRDRLQAKRVRPNPRA